MNRLRPIVLFTLIGVVLAACGSPAAPAASTSDPAAAADAPATAPAAPGEHTKVVWWTESTEEPARQAIDELFVKSFEAANPDIDLEISYKEEIDTVLRTAMQAGAGPDIVQTPGGSFIAEYVAAGFVTPLDEFATQYGWNDKIFAWALDAGKLDGKQYSLPLTYETMVLFYNTKVFADNNLQPPSNRAELEKVAQTLKDKDIDPFVNAGTYNNGWVMPVLLSSYAGSDTVYRALNGEIPWTDPLLVEPAKIFNDWMQKGWFSGNKETYFALDYDTYHANFAAGKGGMNIEGTWAFNSLNTAFEANPQDWDWVQFPALREGVQPSFDMGIGSTLSINAKSKNIAAAAKVLDWIYNDPGRAAKIITAVPGEWVVPIKLDKNDFPPETDPRFIRALEAIAQASESGDYGYLEWTFWPAKSADAMSTGMDRVFNNEITPEQYADAVQQAFAEELEAGKVPPIPERK